VTRRDKARPLRNRTRRQLRDALRRSEATRRACIDVLEQGVVVSTVDGQVTLLNDAAQQLLGYTAAELSARYAEGRWETYREDGTVLPPEERPLARMVRTGEGVRDAIVGWRCKDDRFVVLRIAMKPLHDDAGVMTGIVTAFTDITAERRAQETEREAAAAAAAVAAAADELRATQARFMALVQQSSDIICLLGASGTIHYASPAAERILGYDPSSSAKQRFIELVHPDDVRSATEAYADLLRHPGASRSVQVRLLGGDGRWRHMEVHATNRLDDDDVRGIVANVRDITERAEEAARLTWQAYHDTLTGLANRALLQDRLTHALDRARRARELTGVLFIDLDHFKAVNDALGHAAGDQLLMGVAERLTHAVRAGDTIARLGGDEFVILTETLTVRAEATVIAQRVLDLLSTPIHLNGTDVTISASIGVAFDEVHNPELLLRDADAALYQAKHGGRGRYVVHGPPLGVVPAAVPT
jgi:diguanylate cyclase (GGDEF)-like protein/PAS domain S-box-containing protein